MMSNDDTLDIRRATFDDLQRIATQRTAMFTEMGMIYDGDADVLNQRVLAWTQTKLEQGEYHGWMLYDASTEAVFGGAGVWMTHSCPNPLNEIPMTAYVMNVYIAPELRGQGWARRLMETLLKFCRKQGIKKVALHASDAGYPLYESLGFTPTSEMRMDLF